MRAISHNTVLNEKVSTSSRFILNQLILIVFCSFLFQAVFSSAFGPVESGLARAELTTKAQQKHPDAARLIHSPIPEKAPVLLFEVDLTTEDDDDRKSTFSDFCNPFSDNLTNNEGVYTRYLKHLFLHLNSQVNNQPTIAFFILYHSWKSDLT